MRKWGRRLMFSIQFLTRYPLRVQLYLQPDDFPRMTMFFPFVGGLVGLFSVFMAYMGWLTGSNLIASVFAVIGVIWITGGFHLDGLADSVVIFRRHRSPKEKLDLMKDPHVGVGGTIVLCLDILCNIVLVFLLFQKDTHAEVYKILIAVPVASRLSAVTACVSSYSARPSGLGAPFINQTNGWDLFRSLIVATVCLFWMIDWPMILILFVSNILIGLITAAITGKLLDGITGDTLGCANEIGQLAGFALFYFLNFV